MRIDFVINAIRGGGAERVLAALSEVFLKKGHQVKIISFEAISDQYPMNPSIQRIKLSKQVLPTAKASNLWNLYKYYKVKTNRPDVVISFLSLNNLISILVCKYLGIPVIVSEHHNHLHVDNPKWLTKFTWKRIYRYANWVTVLTKYDEPFFKKYKCNVYVMPNPCSFPISEEVERPREKTVIAIGKLNRYHHKGFDNLIEIMSKVLPEKKDWHLKIVGDGENGLKYLKELVKNKGIEDQVEFAGFRKDVKSLLEKSSIFILPSRYEGLPMVLLEAMSQGTTCIAYDCITGPSEIIDNRQNGLLIANQDKQQMSEGLYELMTDSSLRLKLSRNGLTSLDRFDIETIYTKWAELLNSLS
jgi:glycosyltransferase involved in cell wall biosynthesis